MLSPCLAEAACVADGMMYHSETTAFYGSRKVRRVWRSWRSAVSAARQPLQLSQTWQPRQNRQVLLSQVLRDTSRRAQYDAARSAASRSPSGFPGGIYQPGVSEDAFEAAFRRWWEKAGAE